MVIKEVVLEVKTKPLNAGETFCCSMKKAKELFNGTAVFLNFAYLGRDFATFAETPDRYYWKKSVKGRIIVSAQMRSREERPIISFYVLREKDFSAELKAEFEQKYLPEYYRLYQELLNDQSLTITTKLMLVELFDGKLKLHETTLRWR